jgi:hypothetical protein
MGDDAMHVALPAVGRRVLAIFTGAMLALGAASTLSVLSPATVLGACAPLPEPSVAIPAGRVVLVGTVAATENGGRWARVQVEERWFGADDVATEVWVHGGPEAGAVTANDRTYTPGRYLFVVEPAGDHLADSLCTATRRWDATLAQYRPRNVDPVVDGEPDGPPPPLVPAAMIPVLALVSALVIVLVSYRFILVSRRRPPDWMR